MTFKARVRNGVLVPDPALELPEGAEATVEIKSATAPADQSPEPGSLAAMLLRYAGKAKGLPADLSRNHDHYLYGVPKESAHSSPTLRISWLC